MNNGQNNTNRSLLDQSRNQTNTQYQNYLQGANSRLNDASNADTGLRSQISDLYSRGPSAFMPQGMGTPNASGWFNLPYSDRPVGQAGADFSVPKAGYQGFANTGGAETLQPALDAAKQQMSGNIGQGLQDNIRYRATSMVPSFFNNLKSQLATRSNVQGGYSPGYDAQMSKLARDEGGQAYDASRQAEGDIAGLSLNQANQGITNYGNLAGEVNSNKLAGLSGLTGIGNSELGASEFNAGQSNQRYNTDMGMQAQLADLYNRSALAGPAGLLNLYGSAPGATGQAQSGVLSGIGGNAASDNANLSTRASIKDTPWWQPLSSILGGLGGLSSGLSGLGMGSGGSGFGSDGGFTGGGNGDYGGETDNPNPPDWSPGYGDNGVMSSNSGIPPWLQSIFNGGFSGRGYQGFGRSPVMTLGNG